MLTIKICCRLSGSAACNMLLHGQTGGQTDDGTDRQTSWRADRLYLHGESDEGESCCLGHARQQIHCKKIEREKKKELTFYLNIASFFT